MMNESEPKPRGLWEVMRQGESALSDSEESAVADDQSSSPTAEEVPAPPPAWFRGKTDPPPPSEPESAPASAEEEVFAEETESEPEENEVAEVEETVEPVPEPAPFVVGDEESPARARLASMPVKTGRSRGAVLSVLVGLFAVPLTYLATLSGLWTRIPATCLGFGAVVLGLLSFNEIQRSRGRQTGTGWAVAGMVLGTLAMFLGPLVIVPWSAQQRKTDSRETTKQHLEQIGVALEDYHAQAGHYPPGTTYRVESSGSETAMHSWMTELLPYLGERATYHKIDFDKPWSESLNKAPFTRKVPAYLAGDVAKTHNQQGYALAHFSGVGGRVAMEENRFAHAGIFERGSQVRRNDITDGLSQTLIAGEIAQGYRPWGEPGNWRTIGEGLNREDTGFGNAQGTGAMFLHADGSVKFYANKVSPEVLKRLSTRDGNDQSGKE